MSIPCLTNREKMGHLSSKLSELGDRVENNIIYAPRIWWGGRKGVHRGGDGGVDGLVGDTRCILRCQPVAFRKHKLEGYVLTGHNLTTSPLTITLNSIHSEVNGNECFFKRFAWSNVSRSTSHGGGIFSDPG